MPIQVEIWSQDIVENLYPSSEFSAYAVNHDPFVVEGALVHIPRTTLKPNVVKNRTVIPAVPAGRTDSDLNYPLAEYSTDPIYLANAQKYELSYDMRMSIMGENIGAIRTAVQDDMLLSWVGNVTNLGALPVANILQTSGAVVNGHKQIVTADLIALKKAMDNANIPQQGRYLLFAPNLYNDLFTLPELINAQIIGRPDLPSGIITQALGFNIMMRSYTPVYDASLALKPRNAAPVATDRLSVVAWHAGAVTRALGQVTLFEQVNNPTYYGDVYSALVRAAGTRLRNEGVYVLVQG